MLDLLLKLYEVLSSVIFFNIYMVLFWNCFIVVYHQRELLYVGSYTTVSIVSFTPSGQKYSNDDLLNADVYVLYC